ncbi:MAG: peptidase D-alanyl-D-alanine carboxypeptidase 1, D-alanyl-D-alanine carboxypeptidase [Candidatus Saccharibacteria bacterium]|nr:peptidase D-alanyl-D-alanine carboxypeptidase 1, D-alanyl-D-alanine carboxypeptidase [Candidatus Saccharibacteria bacterium]
MTMNRKRIIWAGTAATFVAVITAYSWFTLSRPFAAVQLQTVYRASTLASTEPSLPWPASGEAAISINGSQLRLNNAEQKAVPTASTAKVMTALCVLDKKPLRGNESGPTLTLTQADVDLYNAYIAKNGSVAAVAVGEKITERQALEALMLPSANNLADSLVIWAFGSMQNYVKYANEKAARLGMHDSYFADASGFSPATVSTAEDLVLLGEAALAHGSLATIVKEQTATIPVAGLIRNRNYLLGQNGNIGIKTGNTDEAGGVFLFAADVVPSGQTTTVRVVGAIMNAPDLRTAMEGSVPFSAAVSNSFETDTVIKAGTVIGHYTAPWGQQVDAVAQKDVVILRWKNQKVTPTVSINNVTSTARDKEVVGSVSAKSTYAESQTPVILKGSFTPPSAWWRLTHPEF